MLILGDVLSANDHLITAQIKNDYLNEVMLPTLLLNYFSYYQVETQYFQLELIF